MPEIILTGCAPVPLAHYLKALGVLSVLTKHSHRPVSCAWRQGVFQVESDFSESSIVDFFLHDYIPSPIVVPWSGNDFFVVKRDAKSSVFEKQPTSAKVIEAFIATDCPRLAEYRDTIQKVFVAMNVSGAMSKKSIEGSGTEQKQTKTYFLQALRNRLPEKAVEWIDSAAVIEQRASYFNTLLGGGGGSDGNSHFSDNYMQCLWIVLQDFEAQRRKPITAIGGITFDSRSALVEALFGGQSRGTRIAGLSPVLFDSTRVGGPNQTTGFQAEAGSNPWDFILMLEGSLLFAGALGRKLDDNRAPSARFPFLFDASPVGLGASFLGESAGREIWLPLWAKCTGLGEIRALLSEGRIEKHGRMAKRGTDAFVGAAQLGFDRGITAFQRIGFFKGRIGGDNYFTAVDQGSIVPRRNETVDLLQDFDQALDTLIAAAEGERCPGSIRRGAVELDASVAALAMAVEGRKECLRDVLISLGRMERVLSRSFTWSKDHIRPLHGLREQWLTEADDDSAEFRLATSIAGMRAWLGKDMLYFRQHLEPVTVVPNKERSRVKWADQPGNDVLWHDGDLISVLNAILARRVIRVQQAGVMGWPDWSPRFAKLEDVTAFIEGRTNNDLLADLIWGLALVDWDKIISKEKLDKVTQNPNKTPHSEDSPRIVPSSFYALLRLCFRRAKERDEAIPIVPAILQRAMNRDGEAASELASRRLRASGKSPLVCNLPINGEIVRRTAAAMIFPISPRDFYLLENSILNQLTGQTT
jgi:CRISPR-associated protein Csx17